MVTTRVPLGHSHPNPRNLLKDLVLACASPHMLTQQVREDLVDSSEFKL